MNKCCKQWVDNDFPPKNPKSGVFSEIHLCPTCKTKYKVTFEEIALIGDEGVSEYAILAVDPIK